MEHEKSNYLPMENGKKNCSNSHISKISHKEPSDSGKGPSDSKDLLDTWALVSDDKNSSKSLQGCSKYAQKSNKQE